MKIILGSQSKYRKNLLEKAGFEFEVMASDIDEKAVRSDDFEKLPLLIANAKAENLLPKIKEEAILITSDQVAVCNGELREKPKDKKEAREFLESYNRYPSQANTAVVVVNTKTGKKSEAVDIAKIYFKQIPQEVIEKVVNDGEIFNNAGGFMADDPVLGSYIDHVDGAIDSVIGLPIELTKKLIEEVQ